MIREDEECQVVVTYAKRSCRMCGEESTACIEYAAIHKDAVVCEKCASVVANAYWMKHSGQYLTWPNQVSASNYRTRKRISADIRKQIMERDGYRCVKCSSFIDLEIDHRYPHSKGGSDEPDNLQTLCKLCNGRKKDRTEAAT